MDNLEWTDNDDRLAAFAAIPVGHPVWIATQFFSLIREGEGDEELFAAVVTPESRDAWGDFSFTRDLFNRLENPAFLSRAEVAVGAPDVVYVKMAEGVTESFTFSGDTLISGGRVFTLVWRPELGGWRIHAFGNYERPEVAPRTSPGVAPAV